MLAFITRCGLTVADLKTLSLGFVLDTCDIQMRINNSEDIHEDEEHYYQLKDVYSFMAKGYKAGTISKERYDQFITEYEELNEIYGDND